MKSRLQQFLTAEQLSPARLSEILGIQRSGLSHILSGRNKPGFDFIHTLCLKFPSINPDWLITGRGKMYRELLNSPVLEKLNFETAENPIQLAENLPFNDINMNFEPAENSKNILSKPTDHKNKAPERIIVLYSDGTFEDFRSLRNE